MKKIIKYGYIDNSCIEIYKQNTHVFNSRVDDRVKKYATNIITNKKHAKYFFPRKNSKLIKVKITIEETVE